MELHQRSRGDLFGSIRQRFLMLTVLVVMVGVGLLFTSAQAAPQAAVTSFTLINAENNQPINGYNPIPAGTTLNLATLPTRRLNIRANTNPATVGSVRFTLNGAVFSTENVAPYALAGSDNGNYLDWIPANGAHTLSARTYSGGNATGNASNPTALSFSVTDPSNAAISVTSLTLINADTDQPIAGFNPIINNATINVASLPTRRLNIRANTNPATVGSVAFTFDSQATILENMAPYAFKSDAGGNYAVWTPSLGEHTLRSRPYSNANAGGAAGTALSIVFTVIDGDPVATPTSTNTAPTQTSIAQTQIAQTQTAIVPTSTNTAPTQTSIAQTQIAQTQTAIVPTQTAIVPTSTLTATPIAPTIPATATATQTNNNSRTIYLPVVLRQ